MVEWDTFGSRVVSYTTQTRKVRMIENGITEKIICGVPVFITVESIHSKGLSEFREWVQQFRKQTSGDEQRIYCATQNLPLNREMLEVWIGTIPKQFQTRLVKNLKTYAEGDDSPLTIKFKVLAK